MKRERVTAYLNVELIEWIDEMVEKGRFRSRSHGIEESVIIMRQYLKGELLTK